jgi:hypothetical protein
MATRKRDNDEERRERIERQIAVYRKNNPKPLRKKRRAAKKK